MSRYAESRELLVWKSSECVNCEFSLPCPKRLANLRTCFGEDGLDKSNTVAALIKRTVRFACRDRILGRRFRYGAGRKSNQHSSPQTPKVLSAVMECSNFEEFVACQKLG